MRHSKPSVLNRYRIRRYAAHCIAIAALYLLIPVSQAQTDSGNFLLGIALDKTVTIQAKNASLKEVMLELESKTGIVVNFVADNTQRISVDIEDQPIEEAISKLTPNYMIMRDFKNGEEVISEIIIISDDPAAASGGDGSSFLPGGQPAPAIVNEAAATSAPSQDESPPNELVTDPQNNQSSPSISK